MKIMINAMTLEKGGTERVISLLSNYFIQKNEVTIIKNMKSGVEYKFNDRITIKSIQRSNNFISKRLRKISFILLYKLKKEILNFNPDIILSFLPEPSFRVLTLKKFCNKIKDIPVIVAVRNDPKTRYSNPLYHYIMKKLYPLASQIIVQTSQAKKYFKDEIDYNAKVIFNPVSDFALTKRYEGLREKKIVAVGRLNPQKNYMNMIDAFEIVHERHKDYTLQIFGDGYQKKDLQQYIDNKNLSDFIFLRGKTDNIKEQIYTATAFVMSSDYEGMPNSLLEAACLGVPCVSTDCPCGGAREILDYGKNGILVPIKNPSELANGICQLIENSDEAEQYSIRANKNAIKFNKDLILKKWYNEINEIINN